MGDKLTKDEQNAILDEVRIVLEPEDFDLVLNWMASEPTEAEKAGMKRLMERKPNWA